MRKFSAYKKFFSLFACLFIAFNLFGCSCNCNEKKNLLGVWWWNDTLDSDYLDFAKNNGVTEIYYCSDNFNIKTASFIEKANNLNIKVYWLAGEYKWLNDSKNLYTKIALYEKYQKEYPNKKFEGIHLDIEPHQNPNFDENREDLILSLIQLANDLSNDFNAIKFDYDIPFWFNDEISFDNNTKPAYAHMIDVANRVFLMSYRDSSEDIYSVSKDEIDYATKNNKTIFLGVETKSNEGDKVSFQEEGKKIMEEEISKVRKLIPNNFGISIHQIETWYILKEETN